MADLNLEQTLPPPLPTSPAWTPALSWADKLAPHKSPSASDSGDTAASGPPPLASTIADAPPRHSLTAAEGSAARTQSYRVRASKKGGFPVTIEKRKCGKKVVLVSAVEGDVSALLSDLKRYLGAGGVVRYPNAARRDRGTAEIQGERHAERIREFLANSGCVVGLAKKAKEKALKAANASKAKLRRKGKGTTSLSSGGGGGKKGKGSGGAARKKVHIDPSLHLGNRAIKLMKPPQLRAELEARGASTQGNSKVLVGRLKEVVATIAERLAAGDADDDVTFGEEGAAEDERVPEEEGTGDASTVG